MAHWAELDENNIVLRVTVGDNNEADEGYGWLINNLGGVWVQTSYNASIRFKYASIGDTYDATRDAFISPKPYDSWLLDEQTCQWKAPTPKPIEEGKKFTWNEETLSWDEI